MNTRYKILLAGGLTLASCAVVLVAPPLSVSAPDRVTADPSGFAQRFQPALAGIGSTRDLTPVDLGAPPAEPRALQANAQGGRHGHGRR